MTVHTLCWQAAQPGSCKPCDKQYAISWMLFFSAGLASLQMRITTWSWCRRVPSLAPAANAAPQTQGRAAALELSAIDQMARAREDLTKVRPACSSPDPYFC